MRDRMQNEKTNQGNGTAAFLFSQMAGGYGVTAPAAD